MKILVVTKDWLGDILFEVPAVQMIRRRYPQAEIICLAHPRCAEILQRHPAVNRVISFDERGSTLGEKISLIRALRRERIQEAYFFHRSRTRAFLAWLAGIPKRVGYGVKTPNFLTQAVKEPSQALHHAAHFSFLLEQAGFPPADNLAYSFYYSPRDQESLRGFFTEKKGTYVCFHLGANWEPKRWPAEHFAELADLIAQRWPLKIVLTGAEGDLPLGEKVQSLVKKTQTVSLIGKTSLGELAALFASSCFVVSGDSGPMHIASGVGARVLALFGPTDPELTGPRGTGEKIVLSFVPQGYSVPWYGKEFPAQGWLSQILPAQVMEALVSKQWGEPADLRENFQSSGKNAEDQKTLKPILVHTLSNIGDVILTTPVISALAKKFPGHPLSVIVGPRAKGVLEGSRLIQKLIIYDKHSSWKEKIKFIMELRREKYKAVVDLKNSAIPFLVSAEKRSPLLRFFQSVSAREKHLEVLEKMGMAEKNPPPFDFYHEQDMRSVVQKINARGNAADGWITLAPVAASENKTWPLRGYEEVIQGLLRETVFSVVLAGGSREAPMLESLTRLNPERILNLAGQTTLREFAAVIAGGKLLLANDSSAAQLGFEMNQRTVVIFGPTNPAQFARQGSRFRVLYHPDFAGDSFFKVTPEEVLSACRELLSQPVLQTEYLPGARA